LLIKEGAETETATDAEAMAYVYPASLQFPLNSDWTQIYLYVCTKTLQSAGRTVPDDIKVEDLDDYRMHQLNDLKRWIYRKRKQARPKTARPQKQAEVIKIDERFQGDQQDLFH